MVIGNCSQLCVLNLTGVNALEVCEKILKNLKLNFVLHRYDVFYTGSRFITNHKAPPLYNIICPVIQFISSYRFL